MGSEKLKQENSYQVKAEGRSFIKSIGTFKIRKGDDYTCNEMDIGKPIKLMWV